MPVIPSPVRNWMIHSGRPTASQPTFPQYVQRIWLEIALIYFSVSAFFRRLKSRQNAKFYKGKLTKDKL
jgi:hypothetical protein